MRLLSGSLALQALSIAKLHHDPWYPLDTAASLRSWLTAEAARWAADDPCFAAQLEVGRTELAAGPAYRSLLRRRDEAAAAYQVAPGRLIIEEKVAALIGGDKAVAGLRTFSRGGSDEDDAKTSAKRARAAEKLKAFSGSVKVRQRAVEWQRRNVLPVPRAVP